MNSSYYSRLRLLLKDYPPNKVEDFGNYIYKLQTERNKKGELKAAWSLKTKAETVARLFKTVADYGLYIDGETVFLNCVSKEVKYFFTYHAYKNILLLKYSESKIDIQNVYKGDKYSYKKENGKVFYQHEIANPFNKDRELIGSYCVIKNRRGEFIEFLNKKDIQSIRNVAKTDFIWNNWYDEMVLKSVIRRACKRHFKDLGIGIDKIDNENYDLSMVEVPHELKDAIQKAVTLEELTQIGETVDEELKSSYNYKVFYRQRERELKQKAGCKKMLDDSRLEKAIDAIGSGQYQLENLLTAFDITDEQKKYLLSNPRESFSRNELGLLKQTFQNE